MPGHLQISPRPTLQAAVRLLEEARLPTEDLTEAHCADFFFAGDAAKPSGLVGVEHFGDVALLRSLVVAPDRRSLGDGQALLEHAERAARERGVKSMYLLTTTAEDFFARRGYARLPREHAPTAIQTTREFAGICPASSAFMYRKLK